MQRIAGRPLDFLPLPPSYSLSQLLHYAVTCLKGSNVGKGVVPLLVEAGVLAKVTDYYTLDQVGRTGKVNYRV